MRSRAVVGMQICLVALAQIDLLIPIFKAGNGIPVPINPDRVSLSILTCLRNVVIMPANQPHALKAISRFKMMLTMIRS